MVKPGLFNTVYSLISVGRPIKIQAVKKEDNNFCRFDLNYINRSVQKLKLVAIKAQFK
jgi:hypothetical protein